MEKLFEKRFVETSKFIENMEILLIYLLALLTPLILSHTNQYIVGTIVNASLIVAGINLKGYKKILGIVFMPSLSAILSGYILQVSSIYTVYMIPAIWIGNFLLITFYKYLFVHKSQNYIITSIVAIISKVLIIYIGFNILTKIIIIPQNISNQLSLAMGVNQLITGVLGSLIALIFIKFIYKNRN